VGDLGTSSIREELERLFEREGGARLRRRIRDLILGVAVALLLTVTGLEIYLQRQYGTMDWWSAPARINYCGWTYERLPPSRPAAVPISLQSVLSIPPLFRHVYEERYAPLDGNCPGLLFYRPGPGSMIQYALPTA
jgi:hypothetical protein